MMILTKNLALLTFLYFIQGLPYGFQAKFLPILLRSKGVSLTSVGLFKFLLAPWLCKALWAPLIDSYKTKRLWLLYSISGLIATCICASFISPDHLILLSVVLFSLNFWAATQDIAVDGIAVHLLTMDELGKGNTVQVVGYKLGSIFGGGVLVWFLELLGWHGLFIVLALLYIEAWMFVYVSPILHNTGPNSDTENCSNSSSESSQYEYDVMNSSPTYDLNQDEHLELKDIKKAAENKTSLEGHSEHSLSKLKFVKSLWNTPGTKWMCAYVLTYKLGEQGILGMLPLYLLDKDIAASDVTFWAGIIGQGVSIFGSVLGGYLLSVLPVHMVCNLACLLRLMPMGVLLWTVMLWNSQLASVSFLYCAAIFSYMVIMLLSGVVTTATFTTMMQCSKQAPTVTQATHYTTLATLEVFGKLMFATVSGWLVDYFGYTPVFLLFVMLTIAIVPLFSHYPQYLKDLDNVIIVAKTENETSEESTANSDDDEEMTNIKENTMNVSGDTEISEKHEKSKNLNTRFLDESQSSELQTNTCVFPSKFTDTCQSSDTSSTSPLSTSADESGVRKRKKTS